MQAVSALAARKVGLVLAGGAARGAYEVGVVDYIVEDVARALGREVPLDVLCGTSVGAINVCGLGAFADEPRGRAQRLVASWSALQITDLVRPDAREVFHLLKALVGRAGKVGPEEMRRGGILDPAGLEGLLHRAVPFERIDEHLRAGRLTGVSVSTTHVATGRTVVFVQRALPGLPPWSSDATIFPRAAQLRARHALASAAIPLLFPAVRIDGEFFCDGGLRQNVPLSPARRLGADGLIVVNPRFLRRQTGSEPDASRRAREQAFPGPLFLLGKALNALLLDRIDNDIDRLERINQILDAGTRAYGAGFLDDLNLALGHAPGQGLRPLRVVLIRSSQDIGKLSAEFVRAPAFTTRARGMVGRVMRRLAEGEAHSEADLLSYLLFDGEFARQLIELGRADARARHEELCAFFTRMAGPAEPAAASVG